MHDEGLEAGQNDIRREVLFDWVVRFNTEAKENLSGFFFSDLSATVTVQC